MSLADAQGPGGSSQYLRVNQNERKKVRLILIPGHPIHGDLAEKWMHKIEENPPVGLARGKFVGFESCLNKSRTDSTCPLCSDRGRFPISLRRACNIWSYDDNRLLVLYQGPQVWKQIIEALNMNVEATNTQLASTGQPFVAYTVFTMSQAIDFYITRDGNNAYIVQAIANSTPLPKAVTEADLTDVNTLPDFQLKTPQELLTVMKNVMSSQPQVVMGQAGMQGGLAGGMPIATATVSPPMPQPVYVAPPPTVTGVMAPPSAAAAVPAVFGLPMSPTSPPPSGLTLDDARMIACTVGDKHKGETLGDIADNDPKYLRYLLTKSANIPEGIFRQAVDLVAAVTVDDDAPSANEAAVAGLGDVVAIKRAAIRQGMDNGTIGFESVTTAIIEVCGGFKHLDSVTGPELDAVCVKLGV